MISVAEKNLLLLLITTLLYDCAAGGGIEVQGEDDSTCDLAGCSRGISDKPFGRTQ